MDWEKDREERRKDGRMVYHPSSSLANRGEG
jgi:hypothetical protein